MVILFYGLQSKCTIIFFLLILFQLWPLGAPSGWLHFFFFFCQALSCFLALWDVQAHLVLFLPQPWNQLLSQEALVPFIGGWCLETKIWVLTELVAPRPSQWTELGKTHVYTNLCLHAHLSLFLYLYLYKCICTYIYTYTYMYVYIQETIVRLLPLIPVQTVQVLPAFPPSLFMYLLS